MNTDVIPAGESTQVATRSASPFDGNVVEFKQALTRRGENRSALMAWVRSALVDGVDFGAIKRSNGSMTKPSLRKPGAEKICGMLNVIPTFPTLKDYEQLALQGIPIDLIILRCHLVSMSGEVLADGVGARSMKQDNGDLNKALKMACKSAHIDATLRMGGLSEIFTQDLEDMPPQSFDAPQETTRPQTTGGRGFATEKQLALIERRLAEGAVEAPALCKHFQISALKEVPFAKVNEVLAWIAAPKATSDSAKPQNNAPARPKGLDKVVESGRPEDEYF
jgi:hypothetical protein